MACLTRIRCAINLASSAGLLGLALEELSSSNRDISLSALWRMEFGAANPYSVLRIDTGAGSSQASLMKHLLPGNTPQVILSLNYLMYNSLYTSMQMADEWSQFAYER